MRDGAAPDGDSGRRLVDNGGVRGHDSVLFDLDGVLVDSRVAFARCVGAALASLGLTAPPDAELHQYLGPPLHETFGVLVPRRSQVQPCVDAYRARYRAIAARETRVFPGIERMLDGLAGKVPLVVATSKPHALAEPLLQALALRRFFLAVVGPKLDAQDESKTTTVARALGELPVGARPIMVGDRKYDIAAARHHGLPSIGVLWGIGTEHELRRAGADTVAHDPETLAGMLTSA